MNFVWLRLVNAAIEVAATTALIPATIILAHYGGRFRFMTIAMTWITLTAMTWITGTRISSKQPVTDATIVTTFVVSSVLVCAGSILAWYLYMSHNDRLPPRNSLAA